MPPTPSIFELTPEQIRHLFAQQALPPYRADQLLHWVYKQHVIDPHRMTNLSKDAQRLASQCLRFPTAQILRHQSATDSVQKLLLQWPGPVDTTSPVSNVPLAIVNDPTRQSECVLIPTPPAAGTATLNRSTKGRMTACISSQIGCPVGCTFCASGLGGLDANLTAGQIVEQVWQLANLCVTPGAEGFGTSRNWASGEGRITHVVFMGMGEPLANFDAVTSAVRTLTADWAMGISARRITISTVGLPSQIKRLAGMDLPITLAISLHAPNDALRSKLIPWANSVTIDQLIDAGRFYFDRTGREVTLEYILLNSVNDQPQHAHELARVAKTLRANVNLIRYNEVASLPFSRPSTHAVHSFQAILRRAAVNTHIRASRGRDIAAACGQLRHDHAHPRHTPVTISS